MSDTDYTIYHFGVSGGKDSTALLLWAVNESGYPRDKIRVTFNDTGNEVEETYDYIKMLSDKILPIEVIMPERKFYELAKFKKRFPSSQSRFCTRMLKMIPSQAYILDLMRQGHHVLLHSGVRASESKKRSALQERNWDEFYACDVYRPLFRWSLDDVWAYLAKYNIPKNPLYALGARRVGCFPCIMSSKPEIRAMAKYFPERIDEIRHYESQDFWDGENTHTFFARDKVPLRHRTREITTKSGEKMMVATIDDVVRWSKTGRYRTRQFEMDLDDAGVSCDSSLGHCE